MAPAIAALLPMLGNVFDRLFPDPKDANDAKIKVMEMAQKGELAQLEADVKLASGQLEVNKAEAASSSLWVSGARPFILWICGCALLYSAIVEPMARFVAMVAYGYNGAFPIIDTDITLQLLVGLLGLSGMRSFDKLKGTSK